MNDNNRNTRTLILSFVIAIMALIPLRFVEAGQLLDQELTNTQVLGVTVSNQVVLPNAEVSETPQLEAPFNETKSTTSVSCLSKSDAEAMLNLAKEKFNGGQMTKSEIDNLLGEMLAVENNICK